MTAYFFHREISNEMFHPLWNSSKIWNEISYFIWNFIPQFLGEFHRRWNFMKFIHFFVMKFHPLCFIFWMSREHPPFVAKFLTNGEKQRMYHDFFLNFICKWNFAFTCEFWWIFTKIIVKLHFVFSPWNLTYNADWCSWLLITSPSLCPKDWWSFHETYQFSWKSHVESLIARLLWNFAILLDTSFVSNWTLTRMLVLDATSSASFVFNSQMAVWHADNVQLWKLPI